MVRGGLITKGNMGWIYTEKGEYDKAIVCLKKSLNISKEVGDKIYISQVSGELGIAYYKKGYYKQAIVHMNKAIDLAEMVGIKYDLARFLISKSELQYELKKYKKAEHLNSKGLQCAIQTGNCRYIFQGELLSLKIEYSKGDKQKAKVYDKLLKMLSKADDKNEKAEINFEVYDLLRNGDKKVIPDEKKSYTEKKR